MIKPKKYFFYNSDILNGDGDYIISGCKSTEEGVNFADIMFGMKDRILELLEDYVIRTMSPPDDDTTKKDAIISACDLIDDYLNCKCNGTSENGIVKTIMESPQMVAWLDKIQGRFTDMKKSFQYNGRATNNAVKSENREEAKRILELVKETTFESFLEELSTVAN